MKVVQTIKRITAVCAAAVLVAGLMAGCSAQKKKYVILEKSLSDEEYGIGFRKADQSLRDEVERLLCEMKKDGKFAEISKKWFDADVCTLPDEFAPAESTDDSLQKIKDKGEMVIGLDVALPPMGFRDENGEISGFDIDLAKEVCSRMGVTAKFQPITWSAKETELDTNKIDCIWNGYTINDDRKAKVNMTDAYMGNRQVLVVMEGSDIKSPDDLKNKRLTLQEGSTASEALDAHPDIKAMLEGGKATTVGDNVTALMELAIGKCDVVLMDETVARYYAAHQDQVKETSEE